MTGTYSILGLDAFVLIYLGSTCSFISDEFALRVQSIIESLKHDLCVSMLARGVVVTNRVVKSCPIVIDVMTLHADLVVIKLEEFNVILGMDWLFRYHAIVNFHTKEMVIEIPG